MSEKNKQYTREELLTFFDDNQRNVYKKFPSTHLLSNPENAANFIMLVTYYRRNMHRFAMDYLGIKLHLYQIIILYLLGRSTFFVMIAARASAKSFVIGVFDSCRAILYPYSTLGITSGTRGQSGLIITKKILGELAPRYPRLDHEIESTKTATAETKIKWKNDSEIISITCAPTSRGYRTTGNTNEEAREIKKSLLDKIISPFQFIRPAEYRALPEYQNIPELQEESVDVYISSSIEDVHWLYKTAKNALSTYYRTGNGFLIAMDYSISLKHEIRSREQLSREKRNIDPVTWLIEYENAALRSNSKVFFDYDLIKTCQTGKKAFYPRKAEDVINKKPNPYAIPKQRDEVRIVSCDIALVDRDGNDNSCYSCLRLLPDSIGEYDGREQKQYSVKVPYLEAMRGTDTRKQAIRIRQLFADFDADYIVLDVRNAGTNVLYDLGRTLYDDERCVEYPPIKAMNDETLARTCTSTTAQPIVFCISATSKLNSTIAVNFKGMLSTQKIELLVPKDEGVEEINKYISEYRNTDDPDIQLFYEKPYLQTMLLFSELINLEYEKNDVGIIKIKERPSMTKDRYTSVSYGCYFAMELSRELLREEEELNFGDIVFCVSNINF